MLDGLALDVSVGIGATHMCGILYSALGKYPNACTATGRANAVAAIKRLAKKAADTSDVVLGLEVVNRYETNLLNTAEQAMAFVNDVDEPNVKIHLDTYHMNIEERSLEAAVVLCGDRLGYVHVASPIAGLSVWATWTSTPCSAGFDASTTTVPSRSRASAVTS